MFLPEVHHVSAALLGIARKTFGIVFVCAAAAALAGCGQKGPLVLPDGVSRGIPAAPQAGQAQPPQSGAGEGDERAADDGREEADDSDSDNDNDNDNDNGDDDR